MTLVQSVRRVWVSGFDFAVSSGLPHPLAPTQEVQDSPRSCATSPGAVLISQTKQDHHSFCPPSLRTHWPRAGEFGPGRGFSFQVLVDRSCTGTVSALARKVWLSVPDPLQKQSTS
eukprot:1449888-Rhodomonas_salina.2